VNSDIDVFRLLCSRKYAISDAALVSLLNESVCLNELLDHQSFINH